MSITRVGRRTVTVVLVGALICTALPFATSGGPGGIARAAEPRLPSLALPADEDGTADAGLAVSDVPLELPQAGDPQAPIDRLTAAIDPMPIGDWDLDAVATALGADPAAAFAFVRDRIGFDPYPGVLRGAGGTLAARAGNAHDRALLLSALLQRMGATSRYAFADLDPGAAGAVLAQSFEDPAEPLPAGTAESVDPDLAAAIATRARRDQARLLQALGDRQIGSPEAEAAAGLLADVTRHVWVQLDDDGSWLDLDPTLADAQPGDVIVPAMQTLDAIPDTDRQSVALRVVAETLVDGVVYQDVVLDERLDAATAAGSQILLAFQPDTGGGLLGGVGGPTSFSPLLSVNGETRAGSSIAIAGDDGGFGLGGGSSIDLTGLLLQVETNVPGHESQLRDRILLDRIPAAIRATGSVTTDQLLPLAVGDAGPLVLGEIHHILVSSGGANPRDTAIEMVNAAALAINELGAADALDRFGIHQLMWPMTAADDALALLSERFIVAGLDRAIEGRAFVGGPRVVVFSVGPAAEDASRLAYRSDLLLDPITLALPASGDGTGDAAVRQWYGVLEAALETETGLQVASAFDPGDRQLVGAGLSTGSTRALAVLTRDDISTLPATAPVALVRALEADHIVVVPGDAATSSVWWTIATADGTTRSILDPGLGAIGLRGVPGFSGYVQAGNSVFIQRQYMQEVADINARRAGIERQLVENMVAISSIGMTSAQYAALAALYRAIAGAILAGRWILRP